MFLLSFIFHMRRQKINFLLTVCLARHENYENISRSQAEKGTKKYYRKIITAPMIDDVALSCFLFFSSIRAKGNKKSTTNYKFTATKGGFIFR